MNIVMKIDGVDSNCEVDGHEKWILCDSLEFVASRPIATETGKAFDRTGTLTQLNDVTITKKMDSNSAKLFELACKADGKKVQIHFVSGAGDKVTNDAEWTLEDTLISHYSITGQGQNEAVETIKLNFAALEIKSIVKDAPNKPGSPYPVKFSRKTGKIG